MEQYVPRSNSRSSPPTTPSTTTKERTKSTSKLSPARYSTTPTTSGTLPRAPTIPFLANSSSRRYSTSQYASTPRLSTFKSASSTSPMPMPSATNSNLSRAALLMLV
eukprot:scaffold16564_cov136-Isochrysis_galbana.AAC.6